VCSLVAALFAGRRGGRECRRAAAQGVGSNYSPAYAAIVVDANSGTVLHASNPMAAPSGFAHQDHDLYMLFERLEVALKLHALK